MSLETDQSALFVPCHRCGYLVPPVSGSVCPECGFIWMDEHSQVQDERISTIDNQGKWLRHHALVWLCLLVVYASGGFVTDRFNPDAFVGIFFGLGFGIFLSNALGLLACQLAPEHERVLYRWIWIRTLWWAHASWIVIGPLTLLGTVLGALFRVIDPEAGNAIFQAVLIPIILLWVVFWFVAGYFYAHAYDKSCIAVGIRKETLLVRIHSVWALIVMIGSGWIGLMGGAIGVYFINWVLTGEHDPYAF